MGEQVGTCESNIIYFSRISFRYENQVAENKYIDNEPCTYNDDFMESLLIIRQQSTITHFGGVILIAQNFSPIEQTRGFRWAHWNFLALALSSGSNSDSSTELQLVRFTEILGSEGSKLNFGG